MNKSWKHQMVVGVVLATSLAAANTEGLAGEPKAHSTIVLHVDTYAEVPQEVLMEAENQAAKIFSRIGVETVWCNRSMSDQTKTPKVVSSQPNSLTGHEIRLMIIPRSKAERLGRSTEALGVAFAGKGDKLGRVAYVFYHGVEDLAKKLKQARSSASASETQILAHAIAHEVGHLLLVSPQRFLSRLDRNHAGRMEFERPEKRRQREAAIHQSSGGTNPISPAARKRTTGLKRTIKRASRAEKHLADARLGEKSISDLGLQISNFRCRGVQTYAHRSGRSRGDRPVICQLSASLSYWPAAVSLEGAAMLRSLSDIPISDLCAFRM